MPRYFVGIDLGTTNTAVASAAVDGDGSITTFAVPQVVSPGEVEALATLPSFLLLPSEHEVPPEGLTLPWVDRPPFSVGTLARERGAELPHRLVSSAKSWLCHTGVDRHGPILPWRGADLETTAEDAAEEDAADAQRVSPVEASSLYLEHVRAAWNHLHPDDPLEEQKVYLTVPASFDAVARELTMAAAQQAGLHQVTLLEEPQAAFYAWLSQARDGWRDQLGAGDTVLVCDIGGGTTDFSIIAVVDDGTGNLTLERVAVGDHILLGGDNIDLALAYTTMQKLGDRLSPLQFRGLVHACRRAKEQLLSPRAPEQIPVSILGRGSKLIGGTVRADLVGEHVRRLVLDGFFPFVDRNAKPQRRKATGLRELGLPYAHDAGVTRHLADFLARHGRPPTAVLFNGGVMKAELLRARVLEMVGGWQGRGEVAALAGTDLGSGGGPRRRLLRPGPRRPGHPDPGRHRALVLHRDRGGHAGHPRLRPPGQGAVCGPLRHGGGDLAQAARGGAGPGGGRDGGVPLLRRQQPQGRQPGGAARSRRRRPRGARSGRGHLDRRPGRRGGRRRAGLAGDEADRAGHARALVRGA